MPPSQLSPGTQTSAIRHSPGRVSPGAEQTIISHKRMVIQSQLARWDPVAFPQKLSIPPRPPSNTLQRLKLDPWLLGRGRNGRVESRGPQKCTDLPWLPSDYS